MAQRILTLELLRDRVCAAAAERSWNSIRLTGVFEQARAPGEPDLSGALARLVAETGAVDIVISALPSELVAKRLLELPFSDSHRLSDAVPYELEAHLPFPVDNAVVAFSRVGHQDGKTLVLAALVRKPDLQHHLDLLAKAGLDPKTVTLALIAVGALLGRAGNGTGPAAHLVVEADQHSTSIVLMDAAGTPRALRTMNGGLLTAGGAPVSADEAAPILNSMRQTLLAHGGKLEPADIVLTGPAAPNAQVRSLVGDALALAVRDGGEFDYSRLFEGAVPGAERFVSCVAMLLGELPVKPLDLINFRQDDFVFRGRVRGDLAPLRTSGILAAALAGAIVLHFSAGVAANLRRLARLDREIAAIAGPVLGEASPRDSKEELRSGIKTMTKRLRLIGGNIAQHSPLDTLIIISRALPARFPVEMQDVQIDANSARMIGQSDSYKTVDQAKRALEQSGYFGAIEVSHAKAASDPKKVDFTIDATFKDSLGAGAE